MQESGSIKQLSAAVWIHIPVVWYHKHTPVVPSKFILPNLCICWHTSVSLVLFSCMSICTPLTPLGPGLKWDLWVCPPFVLAVVACCRMAASVCHWNVRSAHQQAASDHSEALKAHTTGCAANPLLPIHEAWSKSFGRFWVNMRDLIRKWQIGIYYLEMPKSLTVKS